MLENDFVKYEKVLKALANRRRLAIVTLLASGKPTAVGSIAEGIKLSYKATSKHLAVLYGANLLLREQRGAEMHYSRVSLNQLEYPAREIISKL